MPVVLKKKMQELVLIYNLASAYDKLRGFVRRRRRRCRAKRDEVSPVRVTV